jgi:hypothetical protein
MAKAYFSTVLDHPADAVWSVIRPFDHYAWAGVQGETVMEDGRHGDQVGGVRCVTTNGITFRQVLLAHSDAERSYTYGFRGEPTLPVANYVATIRITPVTEGDRAFVEWRACFDCADSDRARLVDQLERTSFPLWLGALRRCMAERAAFSA